VVHPDTRFSRLTMANGILSDRKRGHSRQKRPIGI
jgi:hypothetical protein